MEQFVAILLQFWDSLKLFEVIPPDERGVRVTFGRVATAKDIGHGLRWKLPLLQSISTINVMPQVVDLRAQSVTTIDHLSVAVSGAMEYSVYDPVRALYGVYDYDANLQRMALGIIAHHVNVTPNWRDMDALAKEIRAAMKDKAKECGVRLRRVWITDLSTHRAIRLMGFEPKTGGDE